MQIGMECDSVSYWRKRNNNKHGNQLRLEERILQSIIWEVRIRIMAKGRFEKTNENLEICCSWGLPDKIL
jgi:hypothetical protein